MIYNFLDELKKREEEINLALGNIFQKDDILSEASNYAIMNGGKRIRPILLIEFANLNKFNNKNIFEFAIALELIHNYSLVHDDLPSMDNDDYRRGNLTVHKKFGEDIAILVGDNLLNTSYEIIFNLLLEVDDKEKFIKAAKYLSVQSGQRGMIGGQVIDIENKYNNEYEILDMYVKKTCGLIKAGCKCGAILGKYPEEIIELAEEFGEILGLSFQIKDDILDYVEDVRIEKKTIASVYDIDYARKKLSNYSNRALNILDNLPGDNRFLKDLVSYLVNREF